MTKSIRDMFEEMMANNSDASQPEKDAGFREIADKLAKLQEEYEEAEKDEAIEEEKKVRKAIKKAGLVIVETLNSRLSL